MKKIATLLLFSCSVAILSCGPSEAEQKAAKEKHIKDSVDSLAAHQKTEDSLVNQLMNMTNDTTANKDTAKK